MTTSKKAKAKTPHAPAGKAPRLLDEVLASPNALREAFDDRTAPVVLQA